MSCIEERTKSVCRYCARVMEIVARAVRKTLAATTFMRAQETTRIRIEIVQAVFPDKLSDAGRSNPPA